MAAAKGAKRTVSFFKLVVQSASGKPQAFPQQDWQAFLRNVREMPLLKRTHQGATRKLIGEVLMVDDDYALKLMEPRDENSWLEILQASGGAAEPVDSQRIGELVETTIVVFLHDKNMFGVIRGSTASPTYAAVAEWVGSVKIGGKTLVTTKDHHLHAEPALSQIAKKALAKSDGVAAASIRVSTTQADAMQKSGATILGDTLAKLRHEYGDIMVTVTLKIPRGKKNDEARKELKKETQLWEKSGASKEAITATLVHYDEEQKAHQEDVNFIAQRITVQKGVPLKDETGTPIRNDSAVRAILAAASDMADELSSVV